MPIKPVLPKASESFRFYTRLHLSELTGLKAKDLKELLHHIKHVPGSVIYYHMHHFLQQHQSLSPEPPNDFAYWVSEALNEVKLAEQLSSINTCDFGSIRALRKKIIEIIEDFLKSNKDKPREAKPGEEFYFVKATSFVIPTPYGVDTLKDFVEVLRKVTIHSVYFHMFEAKLRLEKGTNDFSFWLETALAEKELADRIARLDPYTHTMDNLRQRIIEFAEARLEESHS